MSNYFDWQAVLWELPTFMGLAWTVPWSMMAFAAAVLMFLRTVLHEKWSALTFFRSLYIAGLLLLAVSPLNSGWQRWTEPAFAISGLGMAILYFMNWHRESAPIASRMRRLFAGARRPFGVAVNPVHRRYH